MTNKSLAFGLKLVVTILGFSVFMNSAECKRPAKAPAVTAITLKSITIESVTVEATADDKNVFLGDTLA